ncbi:MAG: sigma E protease regulator RseP [Gammaproteobacteria bacterium]
MTDILISLFAFIFAIGILVAIHEYGHFIVARFCGVKVIRFSIGFGRPIFRWQGKRETEYVIAAIPLGGYVKMIDDRQDPPLTPEERPFMFMSKSVWQRIAIVAAGPLMNLLFAVFAYWLMFMIGVQGVIPIVGEVTPNSVAAKIGIQPNEEIVEIEGKPTQTWQEVVLAMVEHIGEEGTITLHTQQKDSDLKKQYQIDLKEWKASEQIEDVLVSLGIVPKQPILPAVVGEVLSGEPSDIAGLEVGDEFLEVNGQTVNTWQETVEHIVVSANKELTFTIKRDGETQHITATPRWFEKEGGERVGYLGVKVKMIPFPDELVRLQRLSPWTAFTQAIDKTIHYSLLTLDMIRKMILGQVSLSNLSGPVTIAHGAGQTASIGIQYYLGFLALISISLGIINFLPIPVLDGGHLFFYLIEAITRRKVSERVQVVGYQIGFTLIIILMSLGFYNDFIRFS